MAQALFASGSFARQPPSSLSTIEDKALTGREGCVRRQQKRGQSGNFLRRPEPLQRQSCGALTDLPSAVLPSLHIGEHITRAYCIDSDLWRQFEGQCLRHFDYACFADVICHIVRNTNEPAHRGSINDDPGGGCTPHQCRGALGHEESSTEVTSRTCCQVSGVTSKHASRTLTPALLKTASTPHHSRCSCSKAPTTSLYTDTSPGIAISAMPAFSDMAVSQSNTATRAPAKANRRTMAAPIPAAPPVTRMRRGVPVLMAGVADGRRAGWLIRPAPCTGSIRAGSEPLPAPKRNLCYRRPRCRPPSPDFLYVSRVTSFWHLTNMCAACCVSDDARRQLLDVGSGCA